MENSLFKSIPVSKPIASNINTKSSVTMFPLAPGAKGQPPIPLIELSIVVIPSSIAANAFAKPRPLVL